MKIRIFNIYLQEADKVAQNCLSEHTRGIVGTKMSPTSDKSNVEDGYLNRPQWLTSRLIKIII